MKVPASRDLRLLQAADPLPPADGKKRFLGLGPEDLFLGTMPTLDPVFDHVYDSAELDRRDLRFSLDKESRPCIRLNSTEQPSSAVSKSVPNKVRFLALSTPCRR